MFSFLKKIFGNQKSVPLSQLLKEGAVVIDVRTAAEFAEGHFKGSINIPLQTIEKRAGRFKKDQHIILCCRSGARSANAKSKMRRMGFQHLYNAGSWTALKKIRT
ncbi:MAG: rhodanese-like domain-containing protein [Crocinitomicaceae bacterium]|nr:rhodanese-like domain-containing protein [Crocinitomicaceae bacterium]